MRLRWWMFGVLLVTAWLSLWTGLWLIWRSSVVRLVECHFRWLEKRAGLLVRRDVGVRNALSAGSGGAFQELAQIADLRISVIDSKGMTIADTLPGHSPGGDGVIHPEIKAALSGRTGRDLRTEPGSRESWVYVAIPVDEDKERLVLRVGAPVPEVAALKVSFWRMGVISSLAAAGLCALAAGAATRYVAKPLGAFRTVLESMAAGDMSARAVSSNIEELRLAFRALNRTADRLAARLEELRLESDGMRTLFSGMAEGVLLVDAESRVTDLNRAAAALLHVEENAVRGRTLQEVARYPELHRFVSGIIEKGGESEKEIILLGEEDRFFQLRGSLIEKPGAHGRCALIIINDVTRLKRLERVRRDFVANVSHELKTPITALRGCVEALASLIGTDGETARFLDMMARNIGRLGSLAEDVMSLARLEDEADAARIALQPACVRVVLENAARRIENLAEAKNVKLTIECAENLMAMMHAELLEQAVGNLIDNAVKYGPEGGMVTITAVAEGGEVVIRVSDQGPGIDKKHLPRIFERFYRVDAARSRAMGGTGLGLAIVKHIALAHRGSVAAQSEVGRGSVFEIRISGVRAPRADERGG